MNYVAHGTVGIGTGLLLGSFVTTDPLLLGGITTFSLLGSLFPDIDKKGTKISNTFKVLGAFIRQVTTHRKQTHSIVLNATVYALLLFLIKNFYTLGNAEPLIIMLTSFFFGVGTHLVLDIVTPMGICALYPINKKFYTLNIFSSGKIGNSFFTIVGAVAGIFGVLNFL